MSAAARVRAAALGMAVGLWASCSGPCGGRAADAPPAPPPAPAAPAVQAAPPPGPPPARPDAQAADLRDPAPSFQLVLFPVKPFPDPAGRQLRNLIRVHFPGLAVRTPEQGPEPRPAVLLGTYQSGGIPPTDLDAAGRGLTPEERAMLAQPAVATVLEFHARKDRVLADLHSAQALAGAVQSKAGGVLLDGETRELLSAAAWRERVQGWFADLPQATQQVTIREGTGSGNARRLVTFGMAKFGLPDLQAYEHPDPDHPGGTGLAQVLHLACQLLIEQPALTGPGRLTMEVARLRHPVVRAGMTRLQLAGAGPATVRLLLAEPTPEDPENRMLQLVPEGPGGPLEAQRQLVKQLFGR